MRRARASASAALGLAWGLALAGLAGCMGDRKPATPVAPSAPRAAPDDRNARGGEGVTRVVYVGQNWSPEESLRYYFTSQGSQIVPYDWFLALENAGDATPFRDDRNLARFGYLLQKPDRWNPDGLPVGFVKDDVRPRAWLGLTCAACHTSQVDYQGVG